MSPAFSIVIPTCDRHLTLVHAIRSVLNNDFGDFEIIVSDNYSSPETYDTVRAVADARIRYVRTPQRLAMRDNWEFALSHATGQYVHFLGDDDALMPDSMGLAWKLFQRHDLSALTWRRNNIYWWPDCTSPTRRNSLSMQFPPQSPVFQLLAARPMVEMVFGCRSFSDYEILPMVYNSYIKKETIGKIKENFGRYFGSHSPDNWSGLMNAWHLENYCFSHRPLSITGISGKSNGWAFTVSSRSELAQHFARESGYKTGCIVHNSLPQYNCHELTNAGLFLDFRDTIGMEGEYLKIDYLNLIKSMLSGMRLRPNEYDDYCAAISELCKNHDIDLAAHELVIPTHPDSQISVNDIGITIGPCYRPDNGVAGMNLFCPTIGIYDVAGAAKLMQSLLPLPPVIQ